VKILLTGSNGNIGSYLQMYLSENHVVYPMKKQQLDITNKALTMEVIDLIKPDLIIHTAALTNMDFCERNETSAYTINTLGSLNVAYPCSLLDIPIVYLSTGYIFDGNKKRPYYETDQCNPINIYGKTKLAGEKLIRTVCRKYFIIRTSWVFGGDNCFVKKVIENKNVPVFLCSNEISNLTYIKDLCYVIEKIIQTEQYGVYNCVNSEAVSKALWIKSIFNLLNIEKEIAEIPESFLCNKALRANYTALDTLLLNNCFNIILPTWQERLNEYISSLNLL
jgi:dTDP-4-dehydrorhamnose reductase